MDSVFVVNVENRGFRTALNHFSDGNTDTSISSSSLQNGCSVSILHDQCMEEITNDQDYKCYMCNTNKVCAKCHQMCNRCVSCVEVFSHCYDVSSPQPYPYCEDIVAMENSGRIDSVIDFVPNNRALSVEQNIFCATVLTNHFVFGGQHSIQLLQQIKSESEVSGIFTLRMSDLAQHSDDSRIRKLVPKYVAEQLSIALAVEADHAHIVEVDGAYYLQGLRRWGNFQVHKHLDDIFENIRLLICPSALPLVGRTGRNTLIDIINISGNCVTDDPHYDYPPAVASAWADNHPCNFYGMKMLINVNDDDMLIGVGTDDRFTIPVRSFCFIAPEVCYFDLRNPSGYAYNYIRGYFDICSFRLNDNSLHYIQEEVDDDEIDEGEENVECDKVFDGDFESVDMDNDEV